MKIAIVAAALPPQLDGIGDYTAHLAAELAKSATVVVLTGAQFPDPIPNVRVETVFSPDVPRSVYKLVAVVERDQPDWVLLQYNPFSFGKWGWNPYLPLAMRQIKRHCLQTRFAWMAHESYVPAINWKFAVMTLWQRQQFRALGLAADVIFFSIESWALRYRSWFPDKPIVHLPVGSNIPHVAITREEARTRLGMTDEKVVLGLFGTAHPSRLLGLVRAAVQDACDENPNVVALYIGPHVKTVCEALAGLPMLSEGPFPAEEVSRRFAAMDIYLVPIAGGVSTRRTSFMTALQHGIPTVSTIGPETDKVLSVENNQAFLLADVDSPTDFPSAVARLAGDRTLQQQLGLYGEQLYQREFAWERIAARLLASLEVHVGERKRL